METTQTQHETMSELALECWSVISFDKHEASGLTYPEAINRLAELEHQRIAGLCIVTDEAAKRLAV
jgi:hypothetical protein